MTTDRQSRAAGGHRGGTEWLAPTAAGPVRSIVRLPGSKSMTNRALVLASQASGPSVIEGPLVARDTRLMADALRAFGCRIDESSGSWRVEPAQPVSSSAHEGPQDRIAAGAGSGRPQITIDVGNAGTVLRFVPPLAALTGADVRFTGDERASHRPVGPLLDALRQIGAEISDGGAGSVPFIVHGHGGLAGGTAVVDASASSQFVSALLLAGARFRAGLLIRHSGPPVPSAPHIHMTVRMLRAHGVDVRIGAQVPVTAGTPAGQAAQGRRGRQEPQDGPAAPGADAWQVLPGQVAGGRFTIEPDLSNALPFLAAALATGGEVTIADWPTDSLQPASRIIGLLTAMGADIRHTPRGLRVSGSGRIRGVGADLSEVSEFTPVLTALAALASSPSEFTGIAHVRGHETDRLAALVKEIGKLGGDVTELADGLRIRPAPLRARGVVFDSHDDHRMVMAAAVLGLVTDGLEVHQAATVGKTFPGFAQAWARLLAPAA